MGKYVDLDLINARSVERDQLIQDGKYIETIEGEGRSPESIKAAAKKILGLGDDGIILLEANNLVIKQNLKTKAFVSLSNFVAKATSVEMLTEEETKTVQDLESRLAKEICSVYNIELEDLYSEGE